MIFIESWIDMHNISLCIDMKNYKKQNLEGGHDTLFSVTL